jgi:hypothetical protein
MTVEKWQVGFGAKPCGYGIRHRCALAGLNGGSDDLASMAPTVTPGCVFYRREVPLR